MMQICKATLDSYLIEEVRVLLNGRGSGWLRAMKIPPAVQMWWWRYREVATALFQDLVVVMDPSPGTADDVTGSVLMARICGQICMAVESKEDRGWHFTTGKGKKGLGHWRFVLWPRPGNGCYVMRRTAIWKAESIQASQERLHQSNLVEEILSSVECPRHQPGDYRIHRKERVRMRCSHLSGQDLAISDNLIRRLRKLKKKKQFCKGRTDIQLRQFESRDEGLFDNRIFSCLVISPPGVHSHKLVFA